MKKESTKVAKKKEPGKVMKWLNDHTIEILMGALVAGSAGAGILLSKDYFYAKGYMKGLVEYRLKHIELAKTILDEGGHDAAFTALELVRNDESNYKLLSEHPDSVIQKVCDIYYSSGYGKTMTDLFDAELKMYEK